MACKGSYRPSKVKGHHHLAGMVWAFSVSGGEDVASQDGSGGNTQDTGPSRQCPKLVLLEAGSEEGLALLFWGAWWVQAPTAAAAISQHPLLIADHADL